MNLMFRVLYGIIRALFRERTEVGNCTSALSLRVLPNNIDINFHMNNGHYLTICDLNRIDWFARSGLLKAMFKRSRIPVIAEHTMTYKKPLNIFERYTVKLEVIRRDEKYFYMKHTFEKGDRVVAEGTSKGCVHARGAGVVKPDNAIAAVEQDKTK